MKYFILLLILMFCNLSHTQSILKTYSAQELKDDYDVMVSALKEAHTGLYWYTSYPEYEKIFSSHKKKIKDGMNSYDFFRILSKVVAADKEGHSTVRSSEDIGTFFNKKAKFLPFAVKVVGEKICLLNNLNKNNTKGYVIKEINDVHIDSVVNTMFNHISRLSDGYTKTGKYKVLDRLGFSSYYTDYIIGFKDSICSLKVINPKTEKTEIIKLDLVDRNELRKISKNTPRPTKTKQNLFEFNTNLPKKTSVITFNTFHYSRYKKQNLDFRKIVDSLFKIIRKNGTKNLIIDIRNNGGGSEGAEDYLFSYLAKKPYTKYKYVEASAFNYSFIEHTDYKNKEDELYGMLKNEHYLAKDGRILRKSDVLPTVLPQKKIFKGKVYVLISGKTYSGGSEFASIARQHSNAIFIGEETGGGFYGQTSGSYIDLILPNTKMRVTIPLLKFVTNFNCKDIPFGHGVIPDYIVEQSYNNFINGVDSEMEFALKLINKE